MDEQKSQDSVKQLTDKELEEILRKSNEKDDLHHLPMKNGWRHVMRF